MPKNFYKILVASLIVFLVVLSVFLYFYKIKQNSLEVDFLDVGQGDSELIQTPFGQNILVDGGPDKKVMSRLAENLSWWDRKIDLMILTHPHDDHVTGLVDVVKRYDVKKIIYTGVAHTGPNYLAWLKVVRDKKIPVIIIDHPQTIKLGDDCEIEIMFPDENLVGKTPENLNNTSIAMKLVYGKTKFFLAGDIEKDIEHKLSMENIDLSADVFKADHHGSDTSNTEELLRKINPKIVVIEVGKNNQFGHPSGRPLKTFERIGARVYRTDLDGTVRIASDGAKVSAVSANN